MYEKYIEKTERLIDQELGLLERKVFSPATYRTIWGNIKPLAEFLTYLEFKRKEHHQKKIIEGAKNEQKEKDSASQGEGTKEKTS